MLLILVNLLKKADYDSKINETVTNNCMVSSAIKDKCDKW